MYRKNALNLYGWNGNGEHGLTVEFCISTALKRGERIHLSMATIGLVIREENMGTFMAIFLVAFLEFMELSMASMADKKVNNIEKKWRKIRKSVWTLWEDVWARFWTV